MIKEIDYVDLIFNRSIEIKIHHHHVFINAQNTLLCLLGQNETSDGHTDESLKWVCLIDKIKNQDGSVFIGYEWMDDFDLWKEKFVYGKETLPHTLEITSDKEFALVVCLFARDCFNYHRHIVPLMKEKKKPKKERSFSRFELMEV